MYVGGLQSLWVSTWSVLPRLHCSHYISNMHSLCQYALICAHIQYESRYQNTMGTSRRRFSVNYTADMDGPLEICFRKISHGRVCIEPLRSPLRKSHQVCQIIKASEYSTMTSGRTIKISLCKLPGSVKGPPTIEENPWDYRAAVAL